LLQINVVAARLFQNLLALGQREPMSAAGQQRHFKRASGMSAVAPIATELLRYGKRRRGLKGNIKGSPQAR
jgi:hypothetical protein